MRVICYFLYYYFARHLPRSYEFGQAGRLCNRLRYFLCRPLIGRSTGYFRIERGADFGGGKNIAIDEFGGLGENARVMGEGEVIVGKHVMMGPDVMILTSDHKMTPQGYDEYEHGKVEIRDHAWIGARAVILKNVTIGRYAVIGAGAVVTKDVGDYEVAVGVPAKAVHRREEMLGGQTEA